MRATSGKFETVDQYFAVLTPGKRNLMKELRKTIKLAAPKAEELISYNMPAFKLGSMLVYYAMHTEHIGLYPFSTAINAFKKDLAKYETSKGAIKFPIDEPLPLGLITKIVTYRVKENLAKTAEKKSKK